MCTTITTGTPIRVYQVCLIRSQSVAKDRYAVVVTNTLSLQ